MVVTRLDVRISGRICHLSFAGNQPRSQFNGRDAAGSRPEEYRWSSAAAHLSDGKDRSRRLDLEFWSKAGAQTWQEIREARESADHLHLLRRCTYSGRPYGEENFVTRLEQHFQRSWRRWGFERLAVLVSA